LVRAIALLLMVEEGDERGVEEGVSGGLLGPPTLHWARAPQCQQETRNKHSHPAAAKHTCGVHFARAAIEPVQLLGLHVVTSTSGATALISASWCHMCACGQGVQLAGIAGLIVNSCHRPGGHCRHTFVSTSGRPSDISRHGSWRRGCA
jgi:hypothetical protein